MEYSPDDSGLTVAVLSYLESHPELLAAAREVREITPAEVARLRKGHAAEVVRGALAVAEARRKGQTKFAGFRAMERELEIWGPPEAVEQASGFDVAQHKARKIQEYLRGSAGMIWDFCSGIGGDAMALAKAGELTAVELSPVRAWCLERNLRLPGKTARVICGRVTAGLEVMGGTTGGVFHIDPARRTAGQRMYRYADLIPGADVIDALMRRFEAGMVKLSPAVDFVSLPEGQLELISGGGTVVQAVLWVGGLAGKERLATVMGSRGVVTVSGTPDGYAGDATGARAFIYEVDGAVHRAGLAAVLAESLGLRPIMGDAGYLTGDGAIEHAALARFRQIETVGFDEKKVLEALRRCAGAGAVEVKTRGGLDVDCDGLQRRWNAAAPCGATVMIYRGADKKVLATICRREN